MSESIVRQADAATGSRGERLLARGRQVALRVWEHEPAGETAPEHANDYEYVGFIVEGAMRVRIGDGDPVDLHAGDSYCVRSGTPYGFEVLETARVVEAVSPADAI